MQGRTGPAVHRFKNRCALSNIYDLAPLALEKAPLNDYNWKNTLSCYIDIGGNFLVDPCRSHNHNIDNDSAFLFEIISHRPLGTKLKPVIVSLMSNCHK